MDSRSACFSETLLIDVLCLITCWFADRNVAYPTCPNMYMLSQELSWILWLLVKLYVYGCTVYGGFLK